MGPVSHGDVVAAARRLYLLPEAGRADALQRLLDQASWAHVFRRATGRVHALWGDGSLMAAAMAAPLPPEPSLADADYCGCLAMVFDRLAEWRVSPTRI